MHDPTSRWTNIDNAWPAYAPDEILPGLWQGGTEDHHVIGNPIPVDHYRFQFPFDFVVTLYADAQPAPWGVQELRFGFYDAGLTPENAKIAIEIAQIAYDQWQRGRRVLIRCQAGVNRSGLISALVLMLHGHSADDAIALLRYRRSPLVLFNRNFEQWLRESAEAALMEHPSAA